MTPLYYLAPRQTVLNYCDNFQFGCHMVWADQANDMVFVKIRHLEEVDHIRWIEQPGVQMLPHPILEQDVDIPDHILDLPEVAAIPRVAAKRAVAAQVNAVAAQAAAAEPQTIDSKPLPLPAGTGMRIHDLIRSMCDPENPSATPLMACTVM